MNERAAVQWRSVGSALRSGMYGWPAPTLSPSRALPIRRDDLLAGELACRQRQEQ